MCGRGKGFGLHLPGLISLPDIFVFGGAGGHGQAVPGITRRVGEDEEDVDQTKGRRDGVEWNGMAEGRRGNEGGNEAKGKRVREERAKRMRTD
ncbi:Hypothetical protein SMAX5B_015341 [Scophthalmus maximus]|uniref:Uncharacterized protein n=1 Tax=Scophthalmus maximus TaxID=52904 RepID=A0A2U9C7K4_SCOMX|nr:Hypothetical protein SMAX5B_015341 [Scophthalmus maximus]